MAIVRLPSTGDAPRATGVPASLVPGGDADSAGFPWQGRTFDHHDTAFADDDGSAPVELSEAVARVRSCAAHLAAANTDTQESATAALAAAITDAVVALSRCRVLIPLIAEAGDLGVTPEGRTVEKTQELSIVTVAAPDGRAVMPVFSSVAAMRRWNPHARPIPVPGPQAALAAAQEHTDLIIVDPGSPDQEFGVRRTQLEALARGVRRAPAWADPGVAREFQTATADDRRVRAVTLLPGDPECRLFTPETTVQIALEPGLDQASLDEVLAGAQQRWALSEVIADRVDSLRVVIREHPEMCS